MALNGKMYLAKVYVTSHSYAVKLYDDREKFKNFVQTELPARNAVIIRQEINFIAR